MAKINFGPLANDARGKVAGIVYSKNKSGSYTRTKVTPANPRTAAQTLVRQTLSTLTKAWSGTLTNGERASWKAYAATYPRLNVFGNSIVLNGLNMFLSLNSVLQNTGNAISTTPPASNVINPIPIDPTSFAAQTAPLVEFSQTALAIDTDDMFYIFAARPLPAGRQPVKSDYRFLEALAPSTGTFPAVLNIGTAYTAMFGPILSGVRISILVATFRTGSGLTTPGLALNGIST